MNNGLVIFLLTQMNYQSTEGTPSNLPLTVPQKSLLL